MDTIGRREIDMLLRKRCLALSWARWNFSPSLIHNYASGSPLQLCIFVFFNIQQYSWAEALIHETKLWQPNIWTLHRLHQTKIRKITSYGLNEMIWYDPVIICKTITSKPEQIEASVPPTRQSPAPVRLTTDAGKCTAKRWELLLICIAPENLLEGQPYVTLSYNCPLNPYFLVLPKLNLNKFGPLELKKTPIFSSKTKIAGFNNWNKDSTGHLYPFK